MNTSPTRTNGATTGGVLDLALSAPLPGVGGIHPANTLLTFSGQTTGNVTVTAKVQGGSVLNAVTDGTIVLTSRDYIFIPSIPLEAVHIAYDGGGVLNVSALQF